VKVVKADRHGDAIGYRLAARVSELLAKELVPVNVDRDQAGNLVVWVEDSDRQALFLNILMRAAGLEGFDAV
jgi:hypothetical protein